jgi:predicted DNA-binding protein (MmcQ/YjbR family)
MDVHAIRAECLSFPGVTETVQWEDHLVFKVGGKSFAITSFEPRGHLCSIKVGPEAFAELIERPGIVPAPYLARAHWVAIENEDAMSPAELRGLLRHAYDLVLSKLPKKLKASLTP